MNKRGYLILLAGLCIFSARPGWPQTSVADIERLLDRGREAFYEAVQEESKVEITQAIFQELSRREDAYHGLAQTYIGAAHTLKGKHAFLPQRKYRYVLDGLQIMDQGLGEASDDLEALFIYGMTCHHLPFFFGRKDDALRTFHTIVGLLEENHQQYDPELVLDVIAFMDEEITLTAGEEATLNSIKGELSGE